ncbi:MAG: hypothetical protein V8R80_01710 [Eubacterium sp.]
MSIIQNVPCLSIMLTLFAAIVTSAVRGRMARRLCIFITVLTGVMSLTAAASGGNRRKLCLYDGALYRPLGK